MGRVNVHPFVDQANILVQQVQAAETAAETLVMSPSTRDSLFHKLLQNQTDLSELQDKIAAPFVAIPEFDKARIHETLQGLDERIIHLYGVIHNRAIDTEVADIAKEAEDLEKTLVNGELDKVKQAFSSLDDHIQTFVEQHALGREGRHTIAAARATRQKAYYFLRTHGLREDRPHLINQFNLLALAAPPPEPMQDDEAMAETVLELYEIAECFYCDKTKDGLQRFHQLCQEAKNRFRIHLAILGESAGDPMADRKKSTQALIAAAYDLADTHDGEPYLNDEQLQDLFTKDGWFT